MKRITRTKKYFIKLDGKMLKKYRYFRNKRTAEEIIKSISNKEEIDSYEVDFIYE